MFYVECDAQWQGDNDLSIIVYQSDHMELEEKTDQYGEIKIHYDYQPRQTPPLYDYDKLQELIKRGQKAAQ